MTVNAVIGLGFGDEGKGLVTDYLCSHYETQLVVRYCGGHQVGHTVVHDDKSHVFSNFGSGTLSGVPTYWSPYCTVEPQGLIRELHKLLDEGIEPKLYIHERCPITTPYDIAQNKYLNGINQHGTVGVGFGTTIQREEELYSVLCGDLQYVNILEIKMNCLKGHYGFDVDLSNFYDSIYELLNSSYVNIVSAMPLYKAGGKVVFEGSQGLLLDKNIGFFPHVTRSNTGSKNIINMGFNPYYYLVTRAYQTRHGNGQMTNENIPHNILINDKETNKINEYQGEFRRSLLDLDLLQYGIWRDGGINLNNSSLVITCLDHIRNEYRFTYKNKIIYCDDEDDFIDKVSNIIGVKQGVYVSDTPYSNKIRRWKK